MTQEISLKQVPVIQYKQELAKIGKSVDERLKKLNLDGQIATIDTIKSLKELRANFNKELKEYESQRTIIKKGILAPYDEFETEYKKEIKEKIEKAIDILKDKITFVEDDLRKTKTKTITEYFTELCESKNIDFLTFEHTGIEINLSTSDKQYKEKCIEFVNKVADDLELIETQKDKTEILIEYKTSLNAARSIKTVQDRKAAIEQAEQQERQNQLNKRIQIVTELGFKFNETKALYEKEGNTISYETLGSITKENFILWVGKNTPQQESVLSDYKIDKPDVEFMDIPVFNTPLLQTVTYLLTGTKTQFDNLDKFLKDNNFKCVKNI